jgi:penicillin-binding protein 1A
MVGGVDYARGPYNRAAEARRQAGSAWKPFVYLAALEAGRTPESPVIDEPVTINGWSPRNYEPGFRGELTLEQALAHSVNTVAARLADEVGRSSVAAAAKRAGIVSAVNTDPAMALGTTAVTPLEMTQAYATFANGGERVAAYGLERIRTSGGQVLYQRKAAGRTQAIGNPALGELNQMLRSVMVSGTGVNARVPGYDLAGKTGTTSDYKDAWFCGYTGGFASCVWMGRDDAKPMARVPGSGAPSEAWRGFMQVALKRTPQRAIPAGPPPPPSADSPPPLSGQPIVAAAPPT